MFWISYQSLARFRLSLLSLPQMECNLSRLCSMSDTLEAVKLEVVNGYVMSMHTPIHVLGS